MTTVTPDTQDITSAVAQLQDEGITVRRGAFERAWVERLRTDVEAAFEEARSREGGAVGRGPQRWYVEVHPQAISGFVDLVSHPWVTALSEAVLGPDWSVVEIGFDVPFPGAADQPWHRDFPSPADTYRDRRLTSLAFNLTCVDTTDEMGPFEIAPGTQWEEGADFEHGMFPPRDSYPHYAALARRAYPRMGDVSARSALTLHRGTRNRSQLSRPVVVLGVAAPGAGDAVEHQPAVTHDYWAALPEEVRRHLDVKVVDELTPITQLHTIEGLVMGEAEA
jgi:ectoine hydroxylase-related dioxygenase (phytanoyl-CoA dioxygenase family)